jgi:holo-[acyl-carrier-protein] synthase
MTVYGIGTDLCDIRRIGATLERRGDRFAERVLGPNELQVWRARTARAPARGLRYLATRFSAKEAFSKAIGLGIRSPMTWRDCEILNLPSGQPYVQLHGALRQWFEDRHLSAHVSVTDETEYAASFVVVEVHGQP